MTGCSDCEKLRERVLQDWKSLRAFRGEARGRMDELEAALAELTKRVEDVEKDGGSQR